MKYKVPVTFTGWGLVNVEAKNKEALLEKLKEKDFLDKIPLPDDWEYVDDSYEVDFDELEMFTEDIWPLYNRKS